MTCITSNLVNEQKCQSKHDDDIWIYFRQLKDEFNFSTELT